MEMKRLQHERNAIAKELEIEKEKTHAYQASIEHLQKQGIKMAGNVDHEVRYRVSLAQYSKNII